MASLNLHVRTYLDQGIPPTESYWVGLDREAFAEAVAARRASQAVPTAKQITWDPAIDATAALMARARVRAKLRVS